MLAMPAQKLYIEQGEKEELRADINWMMPILSVCIGVLQGGSRQIVHIKEHILSSKENCHSTGQVAALVFELQELHR